MKDSYIYKILQELVVENDYLTTEDKLEVLRLLFKQEDLALYTENCEEPVVDADGTV